MISQSASLYVGDLNANVTEACLFNTFCVVGPVASIRVCRDHQNKRSLGYAYVNFKMSNDAERALDTLNYTEIKGRPCRIMWSQRDPDSKRLRKNGEGNVFVSNLDPQIDNRTLLDTFSMFGDILSCKVAQDYNGKSRGFGFVHFELASAAAKAIAKVNGVKVGDKKVYVAKFQTRSERLEALQAKGAFNSYTNLYIKNFPDDWTEDTMRQTFAEYGELRTVSIQHDDNGKSKGFAFVTYKKGEDAANAVEKLHGKEFGESKQALYVQRAQRKAERLRVLNDKWNNQEYNNRSLYIKNLDEDANDDTLREIFNSYGNITSCRVMRTPDGKSKCYGYVTFEHAAEAKNAVAKTNGFVQPSGKHLSTSFANKKDSKFWGQKRGSGQTQKKSPVSHNYNHSYNYNNRAQYYQTPQPMYNHVRFYPVNQNRGYYQNVPRQPRHNMNGRQTKAQEKQMLGEQLFPQVQLIDNVQAGKITGMLLEMQAHELHKILEDTSNDLLTAKVKEAQKVLKNSKKSVNDYNA